ncbi:MAG: asparagine synthase (glutamine-hydrolyzing) [Bacteroidetes bacterium]|nr:asparagine synthase (glutamine-hydrolyzing) [Bacteroidota bacterium]
MCGFNSIFHYNDTRGVDVDELRRTRDRMADRGPDGFGEWFSEDGRVGLGHRRLSIIDLSERGAQPLHSVDGRYSIAFNGEVYNYRALREELLATSWKFHSDTDTEVVIAMYARYGADMLPRLRGMFAFALWDNETRTLFAARDPYGIKPLYYADDGHVIRLASQVKALLAGGAVTADIDHASLLHFLMLGSVPEPETIYSSIKALPAGSWMQVDAAGVRGPVQYFSVAGVLSETQRHQDTKTQRNGIEEHVAEALRESVAHHMIADVPVGAFLSAGIDSGTLVGLVRDAGIADLTTVTLAFEEFRGRHDDEAPLAEEVARHYGTDHRTRMLTHHEFSGDLEHILDVMDQPSIDGINTYYVSKAAKENGLKVALSGLGGDELFAGYNTFIDVPAWVRRFSNPAYRLLNSDFIRAMMSAMLLQGSPGGSPKRAGIFKYGGSYPGAWFLRRGLFMPWELKSIVGEDIVRSALDDARFLARIEAAMTPDPVTPYGRVAALEAGLYMKNQLLRDSDWAGMAHSIEIRVPLVDAFLLRDLAPLLHIHALQRRKTLLAQSPSKPIPEKLLNRAKTGFQVPIRSWLEQDERIDAWKRHPQLAREGVNWERRWAYVLAQKVMGA